MPSLLDGASARIEAALEHIEISRDVAQHLVQPDAALKVSCRCATTDGRLPVFSGYRVRYASKLGPAKGGIRFHPDVNTNPRVRGWMADQYRIIARARTPAVITGDGAFHVLPTMMQRWERDAEGGDCGGAGLRQCRSALCQTRRRCRL